MGSRNIEMLTPIARPMYYEFDSLMKERGIPYVVTSVDRTIVEQMALYVQGRVPLGDVNRFRSVAGLYMLTNSENQYKVTWTLDSKHVTNAFDKDLDNDFSRAFDIAIVKDKKAVWDIKVDVNANDIPDYDEAGKLWESLGGVWGGRWKTPDRPHMQVNL